MKKKIAADVEISINGEVPNILLMIRYFPRKRPYNHDNKPTIDKTLCKILISFVYLIRQSKVIMPPN